MANLRLLVLLLVVSASFDAALGGCRPKRPAYDLLASDSDCPYGGTPVTTCTCDQKCKDRDQFVCGSDGLTYQSECLLRQARCETKMDIKIATKGRCMSLQKVSKCPDSCDGVPENFVCDQNGHRHNNLCEFKLDNCGNSRREVYHTENERCI